MSLAPAWPLLPGVRLDLEGTCNQCGLCCVLDEGGQRLVCEHLDAVVAGGHVLPLGTPMASRCHVYAQRRNGMQIAMRDASGTVRTISRCFHNTWQEDHAIAERGLGRGCSLTMPVTEGELVAFTPSRRD